MYYINVYETSQAYGGSEEGGWWYDVGEFKECKGIFVSRNTAIAAVNDDSDKLERKGKYHMGMHSMDGVAPDGESDDTYLMRGGRWGESSVNVRVEDHVGQDYPLERPYYS
jgi:hypothetical protein